jgi:hypothetical protein
MKILKRFLESDYKQIDFNLSGKNAQPGEKLENGEIENDEKLENGKLQK